MRSLVAAFHVIKSAFTFETSLTLTRELPSGSAQSVKLAPMLWQRSPKTCPRMDSRWRHSLELGLSVNRKGDAHEKVAAAVIQPLDVWQHTHGAHGAEQRRERKFSTW